MALKSVRTPSGCPKPPVRPAPRPKPPKEGPFPPPPPVPFVSGCCGPTSTVVLDNIDVVAGDNVTVEQGFVNGVKAFRISTEESDHIEVDAGKNITVDKTVDGKNVTFTVSAEDPEHVSVAAGENVTVTKTVDGKNTKYTVNAVVPEQKPVKVDPELMYGDGLDTPLGVYEYEGDTAGLVPDAPAEPENKFLRADGTWQTVEIPEQTQSDWSEQDIDAPSYIKNKPGVYAGSEAGLVPSGTVADHEKFLRGDGSWETVITDMPDFIGATANDDGVRGVVPAPQAGDQNKLLRGDGTWASACTANEMNSWLDEADHEANNG